MPTCWAMVWKTSPLLRGFAEALTLSGFLRSSFETGRAGAFFTALVAIPQSPPLRVEMIVLDRGGMGRKQAEGQRGQPTRAPLGCGSDARAGRLAVSRQRAKAEHRAQREGRCRRRNGARAPSSSCAPVHTAVERLGGRHTSAMSGPAGDSPEDERQPDERADAVQSPIADVSGEVLDQWGSSSNSFADSSSRRFSANSGSRGNAGLVGASPAARGCRDSGKIL